MTYEEINRATGLAQAAELIVAKSVRAGDVDIQAAARAVMFLEREYGGPLPYSRASHAWETYVAFARQYRSGEIKVPIPPQA